MLLDSGANVSLISLDTRRKLPNQSESANHIIQVASGTTMHCTEAVSVDIPFGDGILYNVRFIVCPTLPYDFILGINHMGKKFTVDFEEGTATIDKLQTNLLLPGQPIGCTTLEDVTIPADTCCSITVQSPTVEEDLKREEVVILETPTTGFLHDNDLAVLEGLYTNDKYIQTWITNPHPFPLTIPAGTPIATGTTLENVNDRYECNELIEVKKGDKHERDFLEHLEFRRRKFQPETSDAYKNVQLGNSISEDQKAELEQILADNRTAFSVSDSDIGFIKDYMFGITWKDEDAEVYHKPRPCNPSMREKAKSKIDLWRETNVIEPSSSRNNIPLFFIKKGTKGDVRPILDCRAVNEQTIANRFPIPHLKDLLSEISELIGTHGKQELYISTTDIQSAFNQLVVRPEDRHKCAFSFQNRQYQAARCLFGLRNAPSAFCEVMARVLDGLPNCFVLLDDVLLISTSWDEHKKLLAEFLSRCIEHGMTLKPSKTHIAADSIDYLGFKLSKDGIEPLPAKIQPIINFPAPRTKRQVRRFIGLTNFYSKFIVDGTRILQPLYKLCNTTDAFRWQTIHSDAFAKYKETLANYVKLAHRDNTKPLILITDGSLDGIAGALHQRDTDGKLEPLGFVSRSLLPSEERLSSRYIEFLAIVYCLEQFNWELLGNHVTVITDHKSLEEVLKEKEHKMHQPVKILNAHARLARFNVDIIHRPNTFPGIVAIDALSRAIPISRDNEFDEDENIIDRGVSNLAQVNSAAEPRNLRLLAKNPQEDIAIRIQGLAYTSSQIKTKQEEDARIAGLIHDNKCQLNSKGIYVKRQTTGDAPLILVPNSLARELISYIHVTSGHPGAEKLIILLRRAFIIYDVHKLAREICTTCPDCIICKPKPPLKHPDPPAPDFGIKPWDRFYIDLTDFGSLDDFGNRYFLGIMDHATRFLDGCPLPNKRMETVASGLANLILRHNALNGKAVLDNGLEFRNRLTERMLEAFGISLSHISPHHPCGNLIERCWREMGIKAKILNLDRTTWSRDAPILLFHMNNTPHTKLGNLAPSEVLTGRPIHLPCFDRPEQNGNFDEYEWVGFLSNWLHCISKDITNRNRDNHESPDEPNALTRSLDVGTKVAFWAPQRPGMSRKLYRQFGGIATVTRIGQGGAYEITDTNGRRLIRNIKYLRPLPTTNNN